MPPSSQFLLVSCPLLWKSTSSTALKAEIYERRLSSFRVRMRQDFDEMPTAERQQKILGSRNRVCFKSSEAALANSVGIEQI